MKSAGVDIMWTLAFDQTLGNTGVALLADVGRGKPTVMSTWIVKRPDDDLKSFEATYARADSLKERLRALFAEDIYVTTLTAIVCEMPAAHGYRTESSLMAGYVLRQVVAELDVDLSVTIVANQHAKKVLTGNARATKAQVKAAVERECQMPTAPIKPWNEHTADAAMLGYTHIMDQRGQSNG